MPSGLRGARLTARASAVWGGAVLVLLVLVVFGVRVAWAERSAQPELVARADVASVTADTASGSSSGLSADPVAQATAPAAAGAEPAAVPAPDALVHVIGAVDEPGVVTVPAGSRVRDVVVAAGGATGKAELHRVNLARVVVDGERIWVPVLGDDPPEDLALPAAPSPEGTPDSGRGAAPAGPVDINTADEAALQELPGVGPVTAAAIAEWRAQHGQFTTVEELLEVSGIGPRTLETLRPLVQVRP